MKKVNCLMVLVLLVLFGDGQVTGPPNAATIKLSNGRWQKGSDKTYTTRHCDTIPFLDLQSLGELIFEVNEQTKGWIS